MQSFRYATIVLLLRITCVHPMDCLTVSDFPYDRFFIIKNRDPLPLEVQGIIVKKLFNIIVHENKNSKNWIDQKKLEKYHLIMPLLLGVNCVNNFRQIQDNLCRPIGPKKLVIPDWFFLTRKEQDVFVRMAQHSLLSQGDVFADDFEIIQNSSNKIVPQGVVLEVNYLKNDLPCIRIKNVSLAICALSVFCLPGIIASDSFIPGIHFIANMLITSAFFSYVIAAAVIFYRYGFEHNYIKRVKF